MVAALPHDCVPTTRDLQISVGGLDNLTQYPFVLPHMLFMPHPGDRHSFTLPLDYR